MNTQNIKQNIKETYGNIAKSGSSCGCGTNAVDADSFAKSLGYTHEELLSIPDGANMALSCGNPTAIANLNVGETVLDLGSGGGFDCFIAAKKVGETGYVIGVDMTPEMIAKATENAKSNGIENVEFRLGDIEHMPVDDSKVDVIISNCVINLASDKRKVFSEALRVLRPGGRISIADIVVIKELPEKVKQSIAAYTGCVAGALPIDEYTQILKDAGFSDVNINIIEQAGSTDSGSCDCGSTDSADPMAKSIDSTMEDGDSIWNYVASVYVEAVK